MESNKFIYENHDETIKVFDAEHGEFGLLYKDELPF